MRKAINTTALIFFIWLVLDTLTIPSMLLNFLIVGELPVVGASLSPTIMMALFGLAAVVIMFEYLARRIEPLGRVRQNIVNPLRRERPTHTTQA